MDVESRAIYRLTDADLVFDVGEAYKNYVLRIRDLPLEGISRAKN